MDKNGDVNNGGMLWLGSANPNSSDTSHAGSTYVYYDSRQGAIQYSYSPQKGFERLQFSKSSKKFGSVFSDMRGRMYRLIKKEGSEVPRGSVKAKKAFGFLQCLFSNGTLAGEAPLTNPFSHTMGDPYGVYAGYGYAAFRDLSDMWQVIQLNDCQDWVTVASLGKNEGSYSPTLCEKKMPFQVFAH